MIGRSGGRHAKVLGTPGTTWEALCEELCWLWRLLLG